MTQKLSRMGHLTSFNNEKSLFITFSYMYKGHEFKPVKQFKQETLTAELM